MRRLSVNDPEFLPRREAAWLEGIASSLPDPARVLEIGTGKGNSFTAIVYGLSLHNDPFIWSVDKGECAEGRQRIVDAQIPVGRYWLTQTQSLDYAYTFNQWVDLIYLDGDHTYIGVRNDILTYIQHLKVGGIIAFDDYCEIHRGVVQAISELMVLPKWELFGRVGRLIAFEKVQD